MRKKIKNVAMGGAILTALYYLFVAIGVTLIWWFISAVFLLLQAN